MADASVAAPSAGLLTGWLLLLLDGGASHGYELARKLQAQQLTVDATYIYRTLRKLERDGCVESEWTKSAVGPARRLYRITPRGRSKLLETVELVAAVRDLQDEFLRAHHRNIERR